MNSSLGLRFLQWLWGLVQAVGATRSLLMSRCEGSGAVGRNTINLPRDPKVVPFWGSYIESYKVTPKRSYFAASG